MRKTLVLLLLIASTVYVSGQVYVMSELDGQTIEACSGNFTLGNYSLGETFTMTICSDDLTDLSISLVINNGYSFPDGTSLCVYDGPSILDPLLVCYDSATISGILEIRATDHNPSGCLTFVFNGSDIGASWDGEIACQFICQYREVEIISATPFIQPDGYINVCWDDNEDQSMPVEFNVQGSYSPTSYPCDDATNVFYWDFGDGSPITSGLGLTTITHNFTERQGYDVFVRIEDSEGCEAAISTPQRVRVSMSPDFIASESSLSPTIICLGEPVEACIGYNEPGFSNACIIPHGIQMAIPDGQGVCASSSIHINCFEPGSTLNSTNELQSIQMNLAHTYLGDLTFFIQCPNGQEVQMGQQGGGGCNLGIPPSVGYWYNITPVATLTMQAAATSQSTLPAGNYASRFSLSGLVGCPLNGTWTLRICDNWAADYGTLFDWTIDFSQTIEPDYWEYTQSYPTFSWLGSYGSYFNEPTNEFCTEMTYLTTEPIFEESEQPVIFSLTDDFGCIHDTTLYLTVRSVADPQCCPIFTTNAGTDNEVCGLEYDLSALLHNGNTGVWSFADGPGEAVFDDPTNPTTSVSVFPFGTYNFVWTEFYLGNEPCAESDSIEIVFNPSVNPFIEEVDDICAGSLPFQIEIESVGELSCFPNNDNFNLVTGTFNPEEPGEYTITNTVLDQCSGQEAVYSISFNVLNTAQVVGFQEICITNDPDPANVEISFNVADAENNPFSDFIVNGVPNLFPSTSFDTIMPSPANYSFTVTDINGCSNTILTGNRDCSCPLFAGTFESFEVQTLCETECSGGNIIHNNDQNSDGGAAIFEFILQTEDNQILAYSANSDFCFNSEDMYYDTVYYISAVCGYPDAENHADLTFSCFSVSQPIPISWSKNPIVSVGNDNDTCGNIIRITSNIPEDGCFGYWTSECEFAPLPNYNLFSNNTWVETQAPAECYFIRTVTNGVCTNSDSLLIEFKLMPTPNAGEDMYVCGLNAQLNGTASIDGSSIMWIAGSLPLSSIYDLNASVHSNYAISYEIKLRESYQGCTAYDEMMITFIDDLNIWSSPGTDYICGTNSSAVVYGQVYDGHWEAFYHDTNTPPNFSYELADNTNDTVYFSFDGFPEGEHNINIDLVWYGINPIGGGICTSTAKKNFLFSQTPIANAGADTIINNCGNCISLNADTTGYSWANFHWVSFLNGQFTEMPSNAQTMYCIDPDYLYGGNSISNEFLWTASNMECFSVDTLKVNFHSYPEIITCPNDTIIYNSNPIILCDTSTYYQVEYFGDSVINNIFYPESVDGVYEILYVLTDSQGCQNSCSFTIEVLLNSSLTKSSNISIFPNPNDGKFTINLENAIDVRKIEILNSAGAVVYEEYYKENIGESIEVEAALVPGLYLLRIVVSDENYISKFVIK